MIPAMVLAEIERRAGQPASALFHLIAGSSTGALVAASLAAPGGTGRPRYAAADIVSIFEEVGAEIFRAPSPQRVRSLNGLVAPRYSGRRLTRFLADTFGEHWLSESLTDLLIPGYDLEERRVYFFKSSEARRDPGRDFLLREMVQVASSAPMFAPPLRVASRDGTLALVLTDAGAFIANQAMCAYAELLSTGRAGEPVVLLSLGTGMVARPIRYERVRRWGVLQWAEQLLTLVPDGYNDTIDYQIRHILANFNPSGDRHYYRIQFPLDDVDAMLDNASPRNLAAIRRKAEQVISERSAELDAVCAALLTE
ncbi:MAG: Patatin-like phospholipase [bacterium ADurb.Bin429]|nr:MAG: Patatin-like phospholipase [bacterium ADurb.Bin429]